VQAGIAETPCEHALSAAVPAVQSRVAVKPAVQSIGPPLSAAPAAQPVGPPLSAAPAAQPVGTTELPVVQAPDPLAIPPRGTRTGDSYLDFVEAGFLGITNSFFNNCRHFRTFSIHVKKNLTTLIVVLFDHNSLIFHEHSLYKPDNRFLCDQGGVDDHVVARGIIDVRMTIPLDPQPQTQARIL
jgi:hypothetical protein